MSVKDLIERLGKFPQDAVVVMCMDWTALPDSDRPSEEQWEDELGDIACVGPKASWVYLLNKSFK